MFFVLLFWSILILLPESCLLNVVGLSECPTDRRSYVVLGIMPLVGFFMAKRS